MKVNLRKIKPENLGHFRFKKLGGKFLMTNEVGEYLFLPEREFNNLLENKIKKDSPIYAELMRDGFIKNKINVDRLAAKYAKKKFFLFSGPSLHIFVVTLRCDNKCLYCHASAKSLKTEGVDMSRDTARKALELVFKSPNKYLSIEFQGGEPLANWPTIKFIIEEGKKRSRKTKKILEFRLISNFNMLTDEKLRYLLKNKVSLAVSLDGPRHLHNFNRPKTEGIGRDNYAQVAKWSKKINQIYSRSKKVKTKLNGVITVSRRSLSQPRQIVDEYVKLQFRDIFLRPLNPYGFTRQSWKKIGYTSREYLVFYKKALDYIIEVNRKGIDLPERTACVYLEKILGEYDPNNTETRSPCGAGIGQLAYNYNGDIYTCDEGRMLSATGDESFKIGNIGSAYRNLIDNPTVKTCCSASCLNGLPGCNDCAYLPYCGTCPLYNYARQGNIFGQMPTNDRCQISQGIMDYLFQKLQDEKVAEVFNSWLK